MPAKPVILICLAVCTTLFLGLFLGPPTLQAAPMLDVVPSADTSAPTGDWLTPPDHTTITTGRVYLSATASDDDSGVDYVQFSAMYSGTWHYLMADMTAPYDYSWDLCPDGVPDGYVELGLQVYDHAGNLFEYDSVHDNRYFYKQDGCGPLRTAYEPDDSWQTAKPIASGETQTRAIAPLGDEDWLTITVTVPSAVDIETSAVVGDTRMWLYDSALQMVDYDDDDGDGSCSWITRTCGTNALAAGQYFVRIDEYADDDEIPEYNVTLLITPCGTIETPTPTQQPTAGPTSTATPSPTPTATHSPTPTTTEVVPPPPPANVQASDGTYDDRVRVTWDNVAGASNYAVFRSETLSDPKVHLCNPTANTFDDINPTLGVVFFYWVEACNAAGCGDFSSPDSGYRRGPADSYEPDDTWDDASVLLSGQAQSHTIAPAGDLDWYVFTVTVTSGLTVETSGVAGDTQLTLFDSEHHEVEFDDDTGQGLFSKITRLCGGPGALAPGSYHLLVNEYGNDHEIEQYNIVLDLTACQVVATPTTTPEPSIHHGWLPIIKK